jgi:mono/diheme cytochrome c family protein
MIGPKLERMLRNWSPRWRPMRFKATLVALVASAVALPLALLAIPYLEIFNEMAVQPKAKAQSYYGWFSDRSLVAERPPVEGTLPMSYFPYKIEGNDEASAKKAAETLENPLEPTLDALKRGQKLFNTFCIVCHGEKGEGNGPIVGPNLYPAPPSLHTAQARGFPDGRIFHVISRGQNKMPPYNDKLEPMERWAVVHYVRALQRTMAADPKGDEK